MSSPTKQTSAPKIEEPTTPIGHSLGFAEYLANLIKAYESSDPVSRLRIHYNLRSDAISKAQQAMISGLKSEKKLEKKRVEVNKNIELVSALGGMGVSEKKEGEENK